MSEENAYILGTDADELYRLGLQHQVWSGETQTGWKLAGFTAGQTILDLGSGPGYCSEELAFITGPAGKVIAVDQSKAYIEHIRQINRLRGLEIEAIHSDFDHMELDANSLDGLYSRWALAWVANPKEVLQKVINALKPGGKVVFHEYYDWKTHQTQPEKPALKRAIAASLKSFKDSEGEIDIGRHLPEILTSLGMEVISMRPMSKMASPGDLTWQWPRSFYDNYFPRLASLGYLTEEEASRALQDMKSLTTAPGASILCPMMVEVIAKKP